MNFEPTEQEAQLIREVAAVFTAKSADPETICVVCLSLLSSCAIEATVTREEFLFSLAGLWDKVVTGVPQAAPSEPDGTLVLLQVTGVIRKNGVRTTQALHILTSILISIAVSSGATREKFMEGLGKSWDLSAAVLQRLKAQQN